MERALKTVLLRQFFFKMAKTFLQNPSVNVNVICHFCTPAQFSELKVVRQKVREFGDNNYLTPKQRKSILGTKIHIGIFF